MLYVYNTYVCVYAAYVYVASIHFFYTYNIRVSTGRALGLELQKIKQLLGLKHVTISNFANKIFAYENIATTLHNHILYTASVNLLRV